jgi:hypothetical protein
MIFLHQRPQKKLQTIFLAALLSWLAPTQSHAEDLAQRIKRLEYQGELWSSNGAEARAIRPLSLAYLLEPSSDRLWAVAMLYRKTCQKAVALESLELYMEMKNCAKLHNDPNCSPIDHGECSKAGNQIADIKKELKCEEWMATDNAKVSVAATDFDAALSLQIRGKDQEAYSAYKRFIETACRHPDGTGPSSHEQQQQPDCDDAKELSTRILSKHSDWARSDEKSAAREDSKPEVVNATYVIPNIVADAPNKEPSDGARRPPQAPTGPDDLQLKKIRAQQELETKRLEVERERQALERERLELQAARDRADAERRRQRDREEQIQANRRAEEESIKARQEEEEALKHPERVGRNARIAGYVLVGVGLAVGLGGGLLASANTPGSKDGTPSGEPTPTQQQAQTIGWSIAGGGLGVAGVGALLWYIGRTMQQGAIVRASQRRNQVLRVTPLAGTTTGIAVHFP